MNLDALMRVCTFSFLQITVALTLLMKELVKQQLHLYKKQRGFQSNLKWRAAHFSVGKAHAEVC